MINCYIISIIIYNPNDTVTAVQSL